MQKENVTAIDFLNFSESHIDLAICHKLMLDFTLLVADDFRKKLKISGSNSVKNSFNRTKIVLFCDDEYMAQDISAKLWELCNKRSSGDNFSPNMVLAEFLRIKSLLDKTKNKLDIISVPSLNAPKFLTESAYYQCNFSELFGDDDIILINLAKYRVEDLSPIAYKNIVKIYEIALASDDDRIKIARDNFKFYRSNKYQVNSIKVTTEINNQQHCFNAEFINKLLF